MKREEIEQKIKEIEALLKQPITLLNYDYYDTLLDIHKKLWDLLYFEVNQKEHFLKK